MQYISYPRIQPSATLDLDHFTLYALTEMWDQIRQAMRIPPTGPENTLQISDAIVVQLKYTENELIRYIDILINSKNYYVFGHHIEEVPLNQQVSQGQVNYTCYNMEEIRYASVNNINLTSTSLLNKVRGLWEDLQDNKFIENKNKKSEMFYYFVFILSECVKSKPCQWGLLYCLDFIERQEGVRKADGFPDLTKAVKAFYKGEEDDLTHYHNYSIFFINWKKTIHYAMSIRSKNSYNDLCEYSDYYNYLKSINSDSLETETLIIHGLTK